MNENEERRFYRFFSVALILGIAAITTSAGAILSELGDPLMGLAFNTVAIFCVLSGWALVNDGRVRDLYNRFGAGIEEVPERGESA